MQHQLEDSVPTQPEVTSDTQNEIPCPTLPYPEATIPRLANNYAPEASRPGKEPSAGKHHQRTAGRTRGRHSGSAFPGHSGAGCTPVPRIDPGLRDPARGGSQDLRLKPSRTRCGLRYQFLFALSSPSFDSPGKDVFWLCPQRENCGPLQDSAPDSRIGRAIDRSGGSGF